MLLSTDAVEFIKAKNFPGIFDTLFVRGGFAAYTAVHGDRDCEKFVEDYETPDNDLTIQAICVCRLIQLLPHPCHALLLVANDVDVRKAATRCMLRVFDVKVLVLSIRMHCNRKSAVEVWEMFPVSQMFVKRTRGEWMQFAQKMSRNKCRLEKWWCECAEPRGDMRGAIRTMAEREMDRLLANIMHELRTRLLEAKRREQEQKRVKGEFKAMSDGEPKAKKRKQTPRTVTVSKTEEKTLLAEAGLEHSKHQSLLAKLDQVLAAKKVCKLGIKLAGIVGALSRVYPLIKWSLKNGVHQFTTKRSPFETEQKLFLHSLDLPASNSARAQLEKMV
jgi:hypothetical protein